MSLKVLLSQPSLPAITYLNQEKEKYPTFREVLDKIEDNYARKLYHQFTNEVEVYLKQNKQLNGVEKAAFLYHVLFAIKSKLSPLRTVGLIDFTVSHLSPEDGMLLIDLFEAGLLDSSDASIRLSIVKGNTFIRANDLSSASDLILTQLGSTLDKQIGVDIDINSAYHEACSNYFRAADDPAQLYQHTLLYLAYTPLNSIPDGLRCTIGLELCVSGLIADGMFDFGDILAMPILTTLGEPQKWIIDFVEAALEGSLSLYHAALTKYPQQVKEAFGQRLVELQLKMTLSSLVDLAFKLPATDRRLPLTAIAKHCQVPDDQCERLVMKAMSFSLLRGSIDGINNELRITWVKPRMVDPQRIDLIRSRFVNWSKNVKQLASQLEDTMPELLAA